MGRLGAAKQEIPARKRRSSEEIKRPVVEFEASGLRQNEFCRNRGLALSTLQRQLKKALLGQRASKRGQPVELARKNQDENSRPACALEVVLCGERIIKVRPDFDSETLGRLARILERL